MRARDRGVTLGELESVYRTRYTHFLRVATAIVGDEATAADAVHDAFVRAVRHRSAFEGRGSVEAWVWRTVVNAARRLRRERLGAMTADRPASTAANGRESSVGEEVRAAVALLPERQRLALFLRYYADLDYSTIARVLEVEAGTVGATLSAARAQLRDSLREVRLVE